jgi:hypothetical protein
MEAKELVHPAQDGKEWYNTIKSFEEKSNTATRRSKWNLMEAKSLQPRKRQVKLLDLNGICRSPAAWES